MYSNAFVPITLLLTLDRLIASSNVTVADLANTIISLLVNNDRLLQTQPFEDAAKKLRDISEHVIQKEDYMKMLIDEATFVKGGKTSSFYEALQDGNEFDFLKADDTKSLYLKLKERLNRDDIVKVLSEKQEYDKNSKGLFKSARKAMSGAGSSELRLRVEEDDVLDAVVDRFLAQTPTDNHNFTNRENSIYWDPQAELEARNEFHRHDGRRLYRGERTTVRYYPFMVSIHVMGRFWCGGVIYWHDLVLTTAACLQLLHNNRFFRENPRVLTIRVGSNHSRIGGEQIDALEVFFHPGYNPRTLNHNIAMVRLRRHLFFTYKRIPKCISLGEFMSPPAPTSEVLLLGWGVKKSSQKMSYEPVFLQSKVLPIYPNIFCKEVYGEKFITQSMFCAGTLTTGEGACDHDAGGPAIIGGKLAGLISFGPTVCGFPNAPTVFTLIGPYIDWIETVRDSMPGYYRGRKRTTITQSYITTTRMPVYLTDFAHIQPIASHLATHEPTETEATTTSTIVVTETTTRAFLREKPLQPMKSIYPAPLDLSGTGVLSIDI